MKEFIIFDMHIELLQDTGVQRCIYTENKLKKIEFKTHVRKHLITSIVLVSVKVRPRLVYENIITTHSNGKRNVLNARL